MSGKGILGGDTHSGIMEQMPQYDLPVLVCKRCGYEWIPRTLSPKKCPSCTKPWHTPEPDEYSVPAVEPPRQFRLAVLDGSRPDREILDELAAKKLVESEEYKRRCEIERRKLNRPVIFRPD